MINKMVEIIPAINADSFEEIKKRIKLVEPYAKWVQIDVANGTFTKNTLWHNPEDLLSLETPINIEVHLMMNDIDKKFENWLSASVKRIIFHISTSQDPEFLIKKIKEAGKQAGIAIAPYESLARAAALKDKVSFFQILGVQPGLPGQKTDEYAFDKIRAMRKFCKECIIEVDGGMNKETGKKAVMAGANVIVAANAVFKNNEIKKNIEELNGALNR